MIWVHPAEFLGFKICVCLGLKRAEQKFGGYKTIEKRETKMFYKGDPAKIRI